ncbi:MAG: hypothetical protein Ct9H90mP25_3550 [Gammaproteobacteria bacterium]|nr:MAG: hypothetical protein Ct9H90mP25_3550 [Gammaproteobacteria bacterium]
MSEEDLIDFTPEIPRCREIASKLVLGPIFTPPSLKVQMVKTHRFLPGAGGGANFPGQIDPETGVLYVPSTRDHMLCRWSNLMIQI